MELTCYRIEKDAPRIVPSRQQRAWMDEFPHRHPYRCLPMTIANAYGWEILATADFEAEWNGGRNISDIVIRSLGDQNRVRRLVSSHFGGGVLTFHAGYLFQTEPDWELMATGPTNDPKDGISFLSGVVETHWLPFPFTMNWRFTRPGIVRWRKDEPFCLVYPVLRNIVEQVEPVVRTLDSNQELKEQYKSWSESRGDFLSKLRSRDAAVVKAGWQRHYFRGERVDDGSAAEGHMKKLHPAKPVYIGIADVEEKSAEDDDRTAVAGSDRSYAGAEERSSREYKIEENPGQVPRPRSIGRTTQSAHDVDRALSEATSSPRDVAATSFLICTTPRSGSNLLAQSLESTGVAGRPQEFFDAVYEENWRKKLDIRTDEEYLPKIINAGRTNNGVFGAKILFFQFDILARHVARAVPGKEGSHPDALAQVFGPTKFIWLHREDKLLQAISWFRAGKSKQWFSLVDMPTAAAHDGINFDSGMLSYFKNKLTEFDDLWRKYFDKHKIDVLELVYESYVHDYRATIEKVLRFLAPPNANDAAPPKPRYLRQADDLTFDFYCRYVEEVPEELLRTPQARRESNRCLAEGASYFRRREFAAAEAALRQAMEWDGLSTTILQNLGSAVASQGRPEEALIFFQRALRLNPDNAEVNRNAGLALEQCGRFDAAESHYRRASELAPTTVPLDRHLNRLVQLRKAARAAGVALLETERE